MTTETGTPIQFMKWQEEEQRWMKYPAVIYYIDRARVDILIFGISSPNTICENIKHFDFAKRGEDFWNHLPNKDDGEYRSEMYLEEFESAVAAKNNGA